MVGSKPRGRVADQQDQRLGGRFLNHLQGRVGGARVHQLGAVDDGDAPASLARRCPEERCQPPDVVDDDLAAHLDRCFGLGMRSTVRRSLWPSAATRWKTGSASSTFKALGSTEQILAGTASQTESAPAGTPGSPCRHLPARSATRPRPTGSAMTASRNRRSASCVADQVRIGPGRRRQFGRRIGVCCLSTAAMTDRIWRRLRRRINAATSSSLPVASIKRQRSGLSATISQERLA